ncbi:MAG TPA: hypothetical protein VGN37_26855 [Actinocatenispora sp.]
MKRALLATLVATSTVVLAAACSEGNTEASRPSRPAAKPTTPRASASASGRPDAPLMYRDVPLNLGDSTAPSCTRQYAYFGTSAAKPYVSTDMPHGDTAMILRSCPDGGGQFSFAANSSRDAYRASGIRDQRGCVELAKTATALNAEIPLRTISPGQQFCVLSLYDGGAAVDVDLVNVQQVSPEAGTLTLAVTGWGDDL